jgi:arylsulfatase A-like enzyme
MGYLTGSEDYTTHVSSDDGYDFRAGSAVNHRAKGQYSTDLIRERALAIISNHPHNASTNSSGLFLYLPFQAVHAPLQAKPGWQRKFTRKSFPAGKAGENRFIYAAMVLEMDASVGAIADELKSSGLYNNSVLLVSSDNGGEPSNGGYNWPYVPLYSITIFMRSVR